MKRLCWIALLAAVPSSAQAMNVATFLEKAERLEKKGMMALVSSDFRLLKGEVQGRLKTIRAERAAAASAHRPTPFCPTGDGLIASKELLAFFRAIPPAQRASTDVSDGLRALLARKYPCR
jgi:hypothetical protein